MAILTFGTDISHFRPIGANNTSDTDTTKIAPNMRSGIKIPGTIGTPVYLDFVSTADIWVRSHYYTSYLKDDVNFLTLSGGGTDLFRLRRKSGSPMTLVVQQWNGSAWADALTFAVDVASTRYKVDLHVNVANAGGIEIYYDDVLKGSFSGDTLLTAQTTLDRVTLSCSADLNNFQSHWISGVFVADEDSRPITAVDLGVTGAGAHTTWTGAYTDVDEIGIPNDADYLSTLNAGDIETFTKQALAAGFSTGYSVIGLGVTARALKSAGSPPNLNLQVRSGSTDGSSANKALDTVYAPYKHIFHVDPATSAAWTVAAVDSAQVGVKSAS